MRWLGLAKRSLSIALDYVAVRESQGIRLVDRESVQTMLGDAALQIDVGRLLTMRAAWLLDRGEFARKEISMAKIVVADVLQQAADTALQLLGARGYSKDTVVEWIYRYARQARLVDGASEVHKGCWRGTCARRARISGAGAPGRRSGRILRRHRRSNPIGGLSTCTPLPTPDAMRHRPPRRRTTRHGDPRALRVHGGRCRIPANVRHEALRALLNWAGCAIGASRHPTVERALAAVAPFAGARQATSWAAATGSTSSTPR
jgi:alkylation response protein AidB-like acyl-CoA dehydrogenase